MISFKLVSVNFDLSKLIHIKGPRSTTAKGLGYMISSLVLSFLIVKSLGENLIESQFIIDYLSELLFLGIFSLFAVLGLFIPTFHYYSRKVKFHAIEATGIDYLYLNDNGTHSGKIKNLIRTECSNAEKEITMIVASGKDTLSPDGFLRDVIEKNKKAKIKILLLKPESKAAYRRAEKIDFRPPEKFSSRIRESIDFLESLQRTNKNLEFRLYSEDPIWRIIKVDQKTIYLFSYYPAATTLDTTCYTYKFRQDRNNDYSYTFHYYFEKLWERASNKRLSPRKTVNGYADIMLNGNLHKVFIKNVSNNGIYFQSNDPNLKGDIVGNNTIVSNIPIIDKNDKLINLKLDLHDKEESNGVYKFICRIREKR